MSVYARKIALHKFNHDLKTRVMVMSLKAGGVGLNLQRANHMIILDRWWNPGNNKIHSFFKGEENLITLY